MSRTKKNSGRGKKAPLIIGVLLAVAFVVVGCIAILPGGGGNTAVSPVPSMTEDVQRSLEAFRGKVVILDFWATWCGPCRVEIPDFIALQNKYRDQGLEVIGVSLDPIMPRGNPGGAPAVAPFMRNYGINYTIWMVSNPASFRGYDVSQGIPTTYVIDRNGRVVRTYVGVRAKSVFENDINQLL